MASAELGEMSVPHAAFERHSAFSSVETIAYNAIATAGPTPFRRIEQEAIPLSDAVARLLRVLKTAAGLLKGQD